jgi:hypothetical protein
MGDRRHRNDSKVHKSIARRFLFMAVFIFILLCVALLVKDSRILNQIPTQITFQRHFQNDDKSFTILMEGQSIQIPLKKVYPNGEKSFYTCDLPSLRYQCGMNQSKGCEAYPQLFKSKDILNHWSPNDPVTREQGNDYDSLCRFNISSPYEFQLARIFQQMEVPFVVYGIKEFDETVAKWKDEDYLLSKMSTHKFKVKILPSNRFFYYRRDMKQGKKTEEDQKIQPFLATTERWTFEEFLKTINQNSDPKPQDPHFYMLLRGEETRSYTPFIYKDLSFLDASSTSRYGDFFVRNKNQAKQRGIMCRFGMKGIITEGHIDVTFNMIAMGKGKKRYILSPPSVCSCQYLHSTGPSARHTRVDWSQINTTEFPLASDCPATEVVLKEGEVLYLPSLWYHHMISLNHQSIQCNLRSGMLLRKTSINFLKQNHCGFEEFQHIIDKIIE